MSFAINIIVGLVTFAVSAIAFANANRVEIIEEQEKRETRMFCSKVSEQASKKDCDKWLEDQKKPLGDRLLTAFCSSSEISTEQASSCLYRTVGEIKYVLRKYRTETPVGR